MTAHATRIENALRELLCTYADGIEGIGEVGSVLQAVLVSLHQFLASLILAVVVAAGTLDRDYQILVVVLVDEDHVIGLALEHTVDEFLLLQVIPRLADIDLRHQPSVASEHSRYDLIEVIGVSRIRVAYEGRIIIEDDPLALEILVIVAEVLSNLRKLALILHVERIDDAEALVRTYLPHHQTVDVGIGIQTDDQR